MPKEIIAIGNIVNDFLVGPIEKIPAGGQVFFVDTARPVLGGTCTIMASGLAKMGVKVKVLGKVGNDVNGDFLLDRLFKNGVDITEISRVNDVQTSVTLCFFSSDGNKKMIFMCPGTNSSLLKEDINLSKYNSDYIFYAGGIEMMPKLRGKPIANILEKAKKKNIKTVLDTVYDPFEEGFSVIKDSLLFVDILFTSLNEVKIYVKSDEPKEIIKFFLRNGSKVIVLKMGKKGSCIYEDGTIYEFPAPDPDNEIKDTMGAGDNFVAGFIAGMVKGFNRIDCMKLATSAAVLSLTSPGGEANYQDFDEVLNFSKRVVLEKKYNLDSI